MRPDVSRSAERGTALVVAIFVLFMLTAAGLILLDVAQGEVGTNVIDLRSKQAFFFAETGLEQGREALRQNRITTGTTAATGPLTTAAGPNGVIDFNLANVRPVYDSSGVVTGFTGCGDDVPLVTINTLNNGWYAAFLTNDPIDGVSSPTDTNDRVIIAGLGGLRGRSFETVEAVIDTKLFVPVPPATIALVGPAVAFQGGTSAAKILTGNDCAGQTVAGIPGFDVPVVGVVGAANETTAEAGIFKPNTYHQGNTTGADTIDNIASTINPGLTDCAGLIQLGQMIRDAADVIGNASTTQLGTASSPQITYIDGDFELNGNNVGYGLLWVTGTLTLKGGPAWYGPIYVVGEGQVLREGGGNHTLVGGNFVANVAGPDGLTGTADDCSGPDGVVGTADDGLGASSWVVDGNGNGETVYCSWYNRQALLRLPVKMVSFRQH